MNTRYLAWILPISCRKENFCKEIWHKLQAIYIQLLFLKCCWFFCGFMKKTSQLSFFASKMNLNFLPIFYGIRYVVCLYKLILWLCGGSTKPKSSTYVILFYLQIGVGTFNFYAKKCPHTPAWKSIFEKITSV